MEINYNKLVRDKIPDIIIRDNEVPITRILNDTEYKKALENKLIEESNEVINSSNKERLYELADLLEIIRSLSKLENSSLEEIIKLADEKKHNVVVLIKKYF